jgi:hypothetical protein
MSDTVGAGHVRAMKRYPALIAAIAVSLSVAATAGDYYDDWAEGDPVPARAAAAHVVIAFIESARQPRGSRGGCPADGKVVQVERGDRFGFGSQLGVTVPCAAFPGRTPYELERTIPMWAMHDRTYARLYFTAEGRLIDYEPLQLKAATRGD